MGEGRYCQVFIWESVELLRKNRPDQEGEFLGLCDGGIYKVTYDEDGKEIGGTPAKKFGELHFVREHIGAGYTAHLVQHLVNYWCKHYKLNMIDHDEEIARLTEHITQDFYNEFYERYTLADDMTTASLKVK